MAKLPFPGVTVYTEEKMANGRTAVPCVILLVLSVTQGPIPAVAAPTISDRRDSAEAGADRSSTACLESDRRTTDPAGAGMPVLSDKVLHGLAGASWALLAAAVVATRVTEAKPREAAAAVAAAGLGSAALAGLAKELMDLAGFGEPELMDALSAILGGLVASAAAYALVLAQARGGAEVSRLSLPLLSFGVVLAVPVAEAWVRSLRVNPGACRKPTGGAAVPRRSDRPKVSNP